MFRVRSVNTIDDFLLPDDTGDFGAFVDLAVAEGETNLDWCFVIEDRDHPVGRLGFTLEPSTSDPDWLGTLPPTELHPFGLQWTGQPEVLETLLREALPRLSGLGPEHVEFRVNRRSTPHHAEAVGVLETIGAPLFQEKAGFEFEADPAAAYPARLAWSTVEDIGVDRFAEVMACCGTGTLDRNDRYYWSHCGPENWARQMMEYLDPDDARMWLIGLRDETPVGYVFVTTDPVLVSTIGHIGVVPEWRGNGYVHDLLAAAAASIAQHDIPFMLSDVDVRNRPMIDAMRNAGHRDSEWHIWHFRPTLG